MRDQLIINRHVTFWYIIEFSDVLNARMILKNKKLFLSSFFCAILFVSCTDFSTSPFFEDAPIETKDKVVGILPFENFPKRDLDSVKKAIEKFYNLKTIVLDKTNLPKMAYTEIRYPRYRADSLLAWMRTQTFDNVDLVIGLTLKDISITKYKDKSRKEIKEPEWKYKDFGIFGLGEIGGSFCVVSSNRLSDGVPDKTFYKRLMRISCHELGHVLGLPHCPNQGCIMSDANESIKTIDNSRGDLCKDCWSIILDK